MNEHRELKTPSKAPELLEFMHNSKVLINGSSYDIITYLNQEEKIFSKLSMDDIRELLAYLNYHNLSRSLSEDIENAKNYKYEYERLLYILTIMFNRKLDINDDYFIIEDFEVRLRSIYSYLLLKHLSTSPISNASYIGYLNHVKDNLKLKYYGIQVNAEVEALRVDPIMKGMLQNDYLDALILGVIAKLLNLTDSMIEDDQIYAYAISYQLLLRSLFLIMNDYDRLMMYESTYQSLLTPNSVAHNIIRMAFISYREDYKEYTDYKKVKVTADVPRENG